MQADRRLRQRAPVVRFDALVHVEHAVDRRLERAGELRHHHVGEVAVAAEDHRRALLLGDAHDVAELDHGAVARQRIGRDRRRGQRLAPGEIALGKPHRDLDRIAALAAMRIADGDAAEQRLQRVVDVALLDAEEFQPVLVDGNAQARARLRRSSRRCRRCREPTANDLLQFRRNRAARRRIRAVDFREQRREHRRSGRHFDHFGDRAGRQRQRLQRSRRSSAMAWLERLRSARGARLTCNSPSSGAARR